MGVPGRHNSQYVTRRFLFCCSLILVCIGPINCILQSQTGTAAIHGQITDAAGKALPAAQLTIRNVNTGTSTVVRTDVNGYFSLPNLAPGQYSITATQAGFQSALDDVSLAVGANPALDMHLIPGDPNQMVRISSATVSSTTSDSSTGGVADSKTVSELASNGRDWTQAATLQGRAMEKDRGNRYQTALAMKGDLQSLKKDSEPGLSTSQRQRPALPYKLRSNAFESPTRRWQVYALLGIIALLLSILIPVGAYYLKQRTGAAGAKNTIAVLPLRNLNNDISVDFLRFALADELSNTLAQNRSLEVRPTSMTQKYVGNNIDIQKAARELHAAIALTGHFVERGENLVVTLEAVHASDDRLIWQTTYIAPAQNLIALQSGLASQVRQGLLPVLSVGQGTEEAGSKPKNAAAYDLYLHSLAIPHDPAANKDALAVLQEVVEMDPTYAPAWQQLGLRSYYDATYADGAEKMLQQSNDAYDKALQLDPDLTIALGQQITNSVERGELGKAYAAAQALVKKKPNSAQAHYALSYVFRYAGMLEPSARECNTALSLDPGNYMFRSCAWTFMDLGQTQRAMDFLRLDAGSEWSAYALPSLLLREGKTAEAKDAVKHMPAAPRYHRDLLEACLGVRPPGDLDRIAKELQANEGSELDPEQVYIQGSLLGYCGKDDAALNLLQSAVERNYCAYANLLNDPLLEKLRANQAFNKVLTAARACTED